MSSKSQRKQLSPRGKSDYHSGYGSDHSGYGHSGHSASGYGHSGSGHSGYGHSGYGHSGNQSSQNLPNFHISINIIIKFEPIFRF